MNKPFTETAEMRKVTGRISRTLFLRVVRRDNQTCRICGKILREDEIEIDHIIPFSKGGAAEEGNLRVLCKPCIRRSDLR